MLPAITGSGASVRVIARSADVLTVVVADAELFAAVGSVVVEADTAVAEIFVPASVAGLTNATTVAICDAPGAVAPAQVHTTGLAALQMPPTLGVTDTKVVSAGNGSVIEAPCASDAPAFDRLATQVRLAPATTGSGLSLRVIDKSAAVVTAVPVVEVLSAGSESGDADEATTEAEIRLPLAAFAGTATTITALRTAAFAVAPTQVQVIGVTSVQVPPALGVAETKLVPTGMGNAKLASIAAAGPVLVSVAV